MNYNKETKKVSLDMGDEMQINTKTTFPKNKIAVPSVKIVEDETTSKTHNYLETRLVNYEMKYRKDDTKFICKRVFKSSEIFGMIRTGFVYTMAICVACVLLFGSVSALNMRLASDVFVDGENVGIVYNKAEFEDTLVNVGKEIDKALGNGEGVIKKATYVPRIVRADSITSLYELHQNVLATYDDMVTAYAIYYGGKLIVSTLDEAAATKAVEDVKAMYTDGINGAKTSFVKEVKVHKEVVPTGTIRATENLDLTIAQATTAGDLTHTVQSNETLWSIAEKYGVTVDEIVQNNEGKISDVITDGDKILIKKSKPLIEVKTVYKTEGEVEIPYEIEKIEDANLFVGKTQIEKQGIMGKKYVKEDVEKVNENIVAKNVIQENIIAEPVKQIERVGTKPVPKEGAVSGTFLRPAYGSVSSRFGRRSSGSHTGIDWASPSGTPIAAADGGTVTRAGWGGGYGNLVVIDHGNGLQTYYGHCSSLNVSVGQKVSKGQKIAAVGSTGNSTGPHLHFEIRKNGVPQNPEVYVH